MAWYSGIEKAGEAVGTFLVDTVDSLQTALDVLGYVPVVGAFPDLINGGIYALRGDTKNMILSAGCAVPGFGDAAGFIKASKKVAKIKIAQKAAGKPAAIVAGEKVKVVKGLMTVGAKAVKSPQLPKPGKEFANFKRWCKVETLKGIDSVIKRLDDAADAAGKGGTTTKSMEDLTKASVDKKLSDYLLNPAHPIGGNKAEWFKKALGFTRENADDLAKQIVFDPNKAVQTGITEFGTKFNQTISIKGANGKVIDVVFAWIENNDGVVRLVTGIPTSK